MEAHPEFSKLITSSDGKVYALTPQYPKISNVTFYRDDMFKKAGITTDPKTIQEFTDVLRKLKSAYADNKNFTLSAAETIFSDFSLHFVPTI